MPAVFSKVAVALLLAAGGANAAVRAQDRPGWAVSVRQYGGHGTETGTAFILALSRELWEVTPSIAEENRAVEPI